MAFEFDIIEDDIGSGKGQVFENDKVANELKQEEKKVSNIKDSVLDKFYPCVVINIHEDSQMSRIRLSALKSLIKGEQRPSGVSVEQAINSDDIFKKVCVMLKSKGNERVVGHITRSQIPYFYSLVGHLDVLFMMSDLKVYSKEKLLAIR